MLFLNLLQKETLPPDIIKIIKVGENGENRYRKFKHTFQSKCIVNIRGENTGGCGGVTPPNLENSRFRRAIEAFAGHQEELYCRAETPSLKFVKGRLGILK